jgi:hypothetical protein
MKESDLVDVGFDTIGNATVICYDRTPVLVTDPWLSANAYFGSWTLSHEIPDAQLTAIRACTFAWISHGHPDHLSVESLQTLGTKKILLPDHRGSRIRNDLAQLGYDVRVLENRKWYQLSDRIRVLCISDYNQDGILLIDVNGRLIVNLNDAADRGWGAFVKATAKKYKISFLLKLAGHGDADMINFLDESGNRIPHLGGRRDPVGQAVAIEMRHYGSRYFIPFSSMHQYQRADSVWANEYATDVSEYPNGFGSPSGEILPAFIRYDCGNDTWTAIDPARLPSRVCKPEEFGDNWNDPLERDELKRLTDYFQSITHLADGFDYLNFRVGNRDNVVPLAKKRFQRAITFGVPRGSLMTAVDYEIFDDLLIGNFMTTTMHGDTANVRLYPDFSPYVGKYADSGRARTEEELEAYFRWYRRQAPYGYFRHTVEEFGRRAAVTAVRPGSRPYRALARMYHFLKGL